MTSDSVIRDQAYQFFIEEAPELLQEIESGILSLQEDRDTAKIHSIMRAAHSLKGGSASVGLEAIKTISHRLETIFKALYSDTVTIDTDLETHLLSAYDCLRLPLLEQLEHGQFDGQQALAAAEPVLNQLELRFGEAIAATADFIPSSEDMGVSMAQAIFETDIAEEIARLAAVIENPAGRELAGELRAQAEVFRGFAELLNLPGFGAIATTALDALERHPQRVDEIAQLALVDFQAGRTEVLSQPASQGGGPSAALLALANSQPAGDVADVTDVADVADVVDITDVANGNGLAPELPVHEETPESLAQIEADLDPDQTFSALGLFDLMAAEAEPAAVSDPAAMTDPAPSPAVEAPETTAQEAQQLDALSRKTAFDELIWAQTPAHLRPSPEVANGHPAGTPATPQPQPSPAPTAPLPAAAPQAAPAPRAQTTTDKVAPGLTVRVEAERLQQMNNLLGELTINRNGLALQNTQLRTAVKDLLSRFGRFQEVVETLRVLSDQMLVAPERQQTRQALSNRLQPGAAMEAAASRRIPALPEQEQEFDSLEMDSYTQLYSQTQTLLEETVQLEEAIEDLSLFGYQSEQSLSRHRKMLSQMQDELMWARMIPLGQVLNRFPRVLRDLSNTYNKSVNLNLSGTDILVDKAVLAKLYDPLVQLLRNSFDHGIETPDLRRQRGKEPVGQIAIQARYQGRQVVIEVRDDGRGLNYDRIRDRAIERGLLNLEDAMTCRPEQLSRFIFEPGFSTARQVSELSGRGVGLDIVRDQLRALNGSISVVSQPGAGTTFTLTLPLTLTIVNLLICFVGPTPLAIRSDSIEEILVPTPAQIRTAGTRQLLAWREESIPLYSLSSLLKYNCFVPEMPPSRVLATVPTPTNWESPVLVLKREGDTFALQVDRLVTEQEMVVKPLGTAIYPPEFTYGCTVLGDGSLVPVIDGPVLLDDMIRQGLTTLSDGSEADALTAIATQNVASDGGEADIQMLQATTVLVVDDAVTLRRTLALSLERAGYRVLQARDGQEALEQLERSQSVEIIICDVEMPNMNGFEFLTKRREIPQFADIPTMMLTSRGNDKHRWLAMKLGAVDYFTKPYLEQELLGAVKTYIEASAVSP